ncbi:major facilitator superfamily domain-containing protein [Mycena maculata]|uniref:Major facilitator superfamily domain-containing protein n=1 Tax=Mycena maculata TaxID=230809 RepID=A0AAD7I5C5_9AGAR|nr:major facilitator superfamily domain-containing protein [Mycena maculata]
MLFLPPTMYSDTPRDNSGITLTESPEKMASADHRVSLDASDDPLCFSHLKKWTAVAMISTGGFCVACASSMAAFAEEGMAAEFHVSREATILSISLFVLGLGAGPLITGPFSEVYGRAIIYRISYVFSVLFCLPVVFAPNLGVALAFRFFLGACGASFLSVAGGSVADMFAGPKVGTPMAVYTIFPNLYWRWTYRIIIIWTFVQLVGTFLFVPESFAPVLLQRKARKLRKDTGDQAYWAPLDHRDISLGRSLLLSCYTPFKLLIFDRMALLLDTWNALLLGILYLMFQAFPIIFEDEHHFDVQSTGLAFLGIALGMVIGLATQPFWNRLLSREAAKHGGKAPPEALLIMAQAGGVMVPLSLYWFAFSTYPQVHWIVPILASIPFGTGIFFVFTATFTYVVTAYRPIAASAMASNSVMRLASAAAFPLFAGAMYNKLGTVGATALLAGLTTIMAPLPFIFYRIGARLRAQSSFTH